MGDFTRFQTRAKKWKFSINSNLGTLELNDNPIGWDELKLSLTRDENYKSVLRGYSANLQYIFEGADELMALEQADGILAESTLTVDKADTNTGLYDEVLSAPHDFAEYSELTENRKGVSIPLIDSLFNQRLKSREDIDIPYDRAADLDGNTMTAGIYKDATIKGREFGDTNVISDYYDADLDNVYHPFSGEIGGGYTQQIFRLFTENVNVRPGYQNVNARKEAIVTKTIADCFYYNEVGETILNIDHSMLFSFTIPASVVTDSLVDINIIKYGFDLDGTSHPLELLAQFNEQSETGRITIYNGVLDYNDTVTLGEREGIIVSMTYGAGGFLEINLDCIFTIKQYSSITSSYYSQFEETICKMALPHEVCEYMVQSITGESGGFRSPYFGRTDIGYSVDGAGALIGITNGKLLRGFETGYLPDEDNSTIKSQLSFAFKEFFDNFYKIRNVTFEVVLEAGKYIVVADLQKNLFKTTVSHTFTTIQKGSFQRVRNLKHFYSKITSGYINQDDDLLSGLEEYNNKISHSTIISNVNNELELISTYNGGSVRAEKQRRKPTSISATEQLSGDNTIFLIDLVRDGTGYKQRTDEGFDDIVGLAGLETYMNLMLTPKENFLTHDWEINTGLAKFPNSIVSFDTSDQTTDMQLLKTGETEYIVENQDIVAGTLTNPIFTGFDVIFNAPFWLDEYKVVESDANSLLAYPAQFGSTDTNYAWVDNVSTGSTDNEGNIVGIEANPPDVATDKVLGTFDDEVIGTFDDELIGVT